MLDIIYFKNGHLTPMAFLLLESDGLSEEERELIATHLSECDECMNAYLESLTETELEEPSEDLSKRIVQQVELASEKRKDRKIIMMQFFKLGIAVCITVVMLFGGVFDVIANLPEQSKPEQSIEQSEPEQSSHSKFIELNRFFHSGFNDIASKFNNSFIRWEEKKNSKKDTSQRRAE